MGIDDFFNDFIERKSIFNDKKVFQSNFTPETIGHREQEITHIAKTLAPALKRDKPSNLFIYGKTGTGKTLSIRYVTQKMERLAKEKNLPLKFVYVNCKLKRVADTEYRLIAHLAREFGSNIPSTGLPTDEVYSIFYRILDSEDQIIVLMLDEIDQLVKKAGDQLLYNLTRINAEIKKAQICLIGISNDMMFTEHLEPRVKSSLSEEEIIFAPYNAVQLQDILRQRARLAFSDERVEAGVIEKCAAFAAREHGDARRALELLRVAGELAEREGKETVALDELDNAEEKLEKDRFTDIVNAQPKQFQATLYSILKIAENRKDILFTGEIYEYYSKLCALLHLRPLTQRRISDILAELDMLGIIHAKIISKGRYGRTREISVILNEDTRITIIKLLEKALEIRV